MPQKNDDLAALEAFLVNNPELENLESLLAQFNIFEVLGAVRQEIRHSEFLAYLMNPQENHGLGDYFIRRFLQAVVSVGDYENLPFNGIDLDIWDLSDLEVRREWRGIDICLLSSKLELVVIIENKIGSGEHSNQLARYQRIIQHEFPLWKKLSIFLTPEGEQPSDDRYFSISYNSICEIIEDIFKSRKASLGPDILSLMEHYTRMLRRHIVSGSEIEVLCQRIYKKHQKALDLIYEYRPDLQNEIFSFLSDLITENDQVVIDDSVKSYINFFPKEWSEKEPFHQGEGWTSLNKLLIFQFRNSPNSLKLHLVIGPGDNDAREKIFKIAQENQQLFNPSRNKLTPRYFTIFHSSILTKTDLINAASIEDVQEKIEKRWDRFLKEKLPRFLAVFNDQDWRQ